MILEKMNPAHVTQIAALEKICFSDPWSENSISSELTNPLSCWLVALDGDRVAGYVGSQTVLDESDMMNIAVSSQYRRMGIAQKLVERLVALLREKNVNSSAGTGGCFPVFSGLFHSFFLLSSKNTKFFPVGFAFWTRLLKGCVLYLVCVISI